MHHVHVRIRVMYVDLKQHNADGALVHGTLVYGER